MAVSSSIKVFAAAALWRVGIARGGRRIVEAAVAGDEDTAVIAGVILVRAGDRAVPIVAAAIDAGAESATLIDVLASIGSDAALQELRKLASATDTELAGIAGEAVKRLAKRRQE